jgi:hypothetical protein
LKPAHPRNGATAAKCFKRFVLVFDDLDDHRITRRAFERALLVIRPVRLDPGEPHPDVAHWWHTGCSSSYGYGSIWDCCIATSRLAAQARFVIVGKGRAQGHATPVVPFRLAASRPTLPSKTQFKLATDKAARVTRCLSEIPKLFSSAFEDSY